MAPHTRGKEMSKAKRKGFPQENHQGSVKDMNYQGSVTEQFLPITEAVDPLAVDPDMSLNDGDNSIKSGPVPFANEKDKRVGR